MIIYYLCVVQFSNAIPLVSQQQMLTLHNDSNKSVAVSVAILSVPWLEVEPRKCNIAAGSQTTLLVTCTPPVAAHTYDDKHGDNDDDAASEGDKPSSDSTVLVLRAENGGDQFVEVLLDIASPQAIERHAVATIAQCSESRRPALSDLYHRLPPVARAGNCCCCFF